MFTHHRATNRQNRWLLFNTKTAVAALNLNGLGLTPVFKITRTYTKIIFAQNGLHVKLSPLKMQTLTNEGDFKPPNKHFLSITTNIEVN